MLQRLCKLPEKRSFFLFGARQTGKTTLVRSLLSPQDWAIDLLKNDTYFSYKKDPSLFRREAEKKIANQPSLRIMIDEIQKVPELLSEVHYLIEQYPGIQFMMTGSNARKLRRGAANLLAGRAFSRMLFPLTYQETAPQFHLEDTLLYGSLPAVLSLSPTDKRDFLRAYTDTYLKEEIQAEALVRNLGGFHRFLEVASAQCGETINFASIARESGIASRTIQSYYEILEDTLIGFRLEAWRKSARKRLLEHPKFYLFDTGVTNAINHRLEGRLDPVQKGRLFEQFIILETVRMLSYQQSDIRAYYWRTNHGAEVDLVLEKNNDLIAGIEIKSSREIARADLTGLRSLKEDYPHAKSFIVSQLPHSFDLDFATVLSFQDYFQWLLTQ